MPVRKYQRLIQKRQVFFKSADIFPVGEFFSAAGKSVI